MQARPSSRILPLALALLAVGCADEWRPRTAGGTVAAGQGGKSAALAGPSTLAMSSSLATARQSTGFARLPDRGNLVGYPAQRIERRDGAYTWHRADLSEAHALAAIADGSLRVTTPAGETLDFMYERHEEHPSGDWTWVGRLERGAAADEIVLTFGDKAAFGTIAQPGREPLRLTIRDGAAWLIETDPARVADIRNRATQPEGPDYLVPPSNASSREADTAASGPSTASASSTAAATSSTAPVIDLVLGYTPGFATMYGGQSQAVTRLNNMVAITNEAYANSQMTGRVRLVHSLQVSFADNTDNGDTLEKLTGYKSGTGPIATDPAFDALRAARDQYGADLVSLVRKFNDPENSGCGIAWMIGGGGSTIDTGDAPFGYSVVSDGTDSGTDGKTYFCREETLAHEIGHNLGSQHDRATATEDGKVKQGAYSYSFGYKTDSTNGNFYTVMAYGDSGQTRYRVFSNPRTTFCGGRACGVSDQTDSARSHAQTMPVIASFRATRVANAVVGRLVGLSNKCLDAANRGTVNGTPLQMYSCNGEPQQLWAFLDSGFIGQGSGRAIDVIGYGTSDGTRAHLWDWAGSPNQRWVFRNFELVAYGNRVLDVGLAQTANGSVVQLWDATGAQNQRWSFDVVTRTIRTPGGKCLDVDSSRGEVDGARVQIWDCHGGVNQQWEMLVGGQLRGYGGRCLDTVDGSQMNGARLHLWQCHPGLSQRWIIRGQLFNPVSGKCLDDPAAGTLDGARPHIWQCHEGANQRWAFITY